MNIKHFFAFIAIIASFVITPVIASAAAGDAIYDTPGIKTYTVPAGVTELYVKVWGAGGGGGITKVDCTGGVFGLGQTCTDRKATGGAGGGYAEARIDVTPGENLTVVVGAGGQGTRPVPEDFADTDTYTGYSASPDYTSSSAEASIVTSQLNGKYIGAGGGATGFSLFGIAFGLTPPRTHTSGSLSGKGAGQAVGGTGAGIAGRTTSWCGDGQGNYGTGCLVIPTGGTGFGTYDGITAVRGASPLMILPFPNVPNFNVSGGAGANGGTGGALNQAGAAPGGGARPSSGTALRGGSGKVIIETVNTSTSGDFDFSLSNSGDVITTPGGVITNLITATAIQGTPRPTNLTVTSITNSSGASVMNTANGITVLNTPFSNSPVTPTQGSLLRLDATPTIPAGVYTVTVSADTPAQSATSVTTAQSGTIYYCKGVYTALSGASLAGGRGETFACSDTQTFDPLKISGAMDFINWDDVSYGAGGVEPYYNTWVYQQWLIALRTVFADTACGKGKWSLYPYGYNALSRTTGFICTSTSSTSTTTTEPAVHKTTTFTITVDTYNLIAEKGADVCSATDAYTRLTWTRNPSAASYRLYKKQGTGTETYVTVPQPSSGTTVTFYDPDSNFSNSTGLTVGDLYTYRVAANVGGVFQASSPISSAFPSSIAPSGSCAMTYTVGGGDVTIQQGASLSVSVPFALTSGATQSVSAQFTPAVTGITFAPALPSCSAIPCTATTVISVANSVAVGTYTYTVSARTSGNVTATNTLIVRVTGNSKPYPVKSLSIIGPCSGDGVVNASSVISYVPSAPTDPDGDAVTYEYQIDYGSGYGAAVSNGTANYFSLTWTAAGSVKVRVRAIDSKGAVSPWTEQGLTIRATCPVGSSLITECISGFNTVTNEAVWFASTSRGTEPYTYSWNNTTFSDTSSFRTYISNVGGTANAPTLVVKDAASSRAVASPSCSPITRPIDTTINYRLKGAVDGDTVTLNIGETKEATIVVASDNGITKPVTVTLSQAYSISSGSNVSYITYTPNTPYTCSSIIPDCIQKINISVNATTGRVGTFKIPISAVASSGENVSGEITVIVTNKPVIWSGINLTLSNGPTTCTQSSIIASWSADPNSAVSGYNIYRWQGSGTKSLMNISGPIAQKSSGTITYTDQSVAAGESYTYEVREIVTGVESTASPYSIRTAPSPTAGTCSGGFGYSITGDTYVAVPGQTVKASARLRLTLGSSKAVNVSISQILSSLEGTQVHAVAKTTILERISAKIASFFGIAHAAEPYITAKFTGTSSCAALPCDIPITITVSPSASENEYIIPLVAKTADTAAITANGQIQLIVSTTPVTKPSTVSVVTLSDGMADCENSSLVITWTKDLNASGYYLYRSQANQSFPVRVNTTAFAQPSGATRTYTDTNLIPSITYTYYVTSIIGGVESKPSATVTRTTPTVPMGPGSCAFSMHVTGDSVSLYPGEEKITKVRIILNLGSNTATTLKIGTVSISTNLAQGSTKSDIAKFLNELFALGPIKLNAAGTVTATFVTNGRCASLPCVIDVKITSAANALAGTYIFPLTASTDGPIPGVGGIVTADGTLPILLQKPLTPGCPPNCNPPPPPPPAFSLGISATPATVTAGQSTSSLVSLFTITPTGVDKSSIVLLEAAKDLNGSKNTNITTVPASFNCNHSVPTCVQNVTISTTKNTAAGSYLIPVTARTSSGETARVDIALTVIDELIAADTPPLTEARVFYPSGAADSVTGWKRDFTYMPRRSAYLAPVTVDIETRKTLQSSSDYTSCYSTVENGTTGWSQGSKNSPVSPSLVFTKKTVTIAGTEIFSVYCKTAAQADFPSDPNIKVKINPINEPVIKEF